MYLNYLHLASYISGINNVFKLNNQRLLMNILIIKVGALGDVVRTTFLAQALKNKYKNKPTKIYWLTSEQAKLLFVNNPYVYKTISDSEINRKKLKKQRFDLVINLEEDKIYTELTKLGREKLGFLLENGKVIPSDSAKEWFDMSLLGEKPKNDILKINCKKPHRQIMSEIAEIKDWKKYEPFLRLHREQVRIAEKFKREHNIQDREMVVGLNLGGADRWPKALPVDLSVKLIHSIYKEFECKIILFGGPKEAERNKNILSLSKSPIIDAGTGNNLFEFPALISVCNYFISTDSLGLHIALGLKKKTICLIGPTQKYEKETFGHGKIIYPESSCVGCFKRDCKSMEKIKIPAIISALKDLSKPPFLNIVITSYKEPRTAKAIEAILSQKIDYPFEIIVSAPDKETQEIVKRYSKKDRRVKLFADPGKGKNLALNILFKKLNGDILIFTDGDVYLGKGAIDKITKMFNDSSIGCVTGRPMPEESKNSKYGYWANFLFEEAHKMRKKSFLNNDFLECSGYLFAFRNRIVESFPLDTAEDTIIPYYFWEKGYKIGYADEAKVYVRNVDNWGEWINQKTRTSIAHENLGDYADIQITPRKKSFFNEAKGASSLFSYPNSITEFYWSFNLLIARLYMWAIVLGNSKLKGKRHSDAWERVESTK